jgi:hypothetical protein
MRSNSHINAEIHGGTSSEINWIAALFGLALLILTQGCAALIPHHDPVANWKLEIGHEPTESITRDYKDFIARLPDNERKTASVMGFFTHPSGKRAIKIETNPNRTSWTYVLIYDATDRRIKTIRYASSYAVT